MSKRFVRDCVGISAIVLGLAVSGCSSHDGSGEVGPGENYGLIPGQLVGKSVQAAHSGGAPSVGSCANLVGEGQENIKFVAAECAQEGKSAYKVVAVTDSPSLCPTDADQRYYFNDNAASAWAVCLDFNWHAGHCLDLGGINAVVTDCDEGKKTYRPTGLRLNATSTEPCPTGGVAHEIRRYTICTQKV